MNVIIYTDSSESWFVPYGHQLKANIEELGHKVKYVHRSSDLNACDIMFMLSCTKLLAPKFLEQNTYNIVVHASDLPSGKGFSPLQWQILEGKDKIPLTLFEAVEAVDDGPYYLKDSIVLDGHELLDEMRMKMSSKIIEMCLRFVVEHKNLDPIVQTGISTFYRKRVEKDDELDVEQSIATQFNHFRIADNDNFPLYFYLHGNKYYLKIYKDGDMGSIG